MSVISEFNPDGTTNYILKDKFAHMFATCSTASNVAAKVVSVSGINELYSGMKILVKFTNTGTTLPSSGNLTLKVGDTAAKTIVLSNSNSQAITYTAGLQFTSNKEYEFIYDGTYWVLTSNISEDILDEYLVTTSEFESM